MNVVQKQNVILSCLSRNNCPQKRKKRKQIQGKGRKNAESRARKIIKERRTMEGKETTEWKKENGQKKFRKQPWCPGYVLVAICFKVK